MKKFLIAFLICLLAALPAYADEAPAQGTYISGEKTVYEISLERAIEMAYDGNRQLEANESAIKGNEFNVKSARLIRREYKKLPVNVSSNFELYCVKNGYAVDAAEMALRISQNENIKIKSDIAYDVTEAYYNLVLMQKLVNAAENSYNLAMDNQRIVDAQYALGMIPQLDYENASLTVTRSENALTSYKLNYEIAEKNLKILLNKDAEDCTIIPTDEIECEEYTPDMPQDTANAMESRFDLNSLKETRDLAEEYFDLSSVLTDSSATYNSAYADYVKADYNYTNTKKLIALSIQSSGNSITTSKADMETARLSYEMKEKEYESAKLKYELGMITNLELTSAINDLYSAQVSYAQAKLTYRLAVEKYKYEISIGL